jgi:hypothetical protein
MNKKTLFVVGPLLLVVLSLFMNWKQWRNSVADQDRIEALSQNTSNGEAKIVDRYIHDSVEHVVIKEVFVKTPAEKAVAVGSGYTDTLARALKVAVKQIDEVTKVNAALVAKLQMKEQAGQPTAMRYHNDKWLTASYDRDTDSLNLKYNVALNQAQYWKRSWLLAPKRYFNDIFSDDPRVSINSVKRFTMADRKPKRFGIGAHVGYGLTLPQLKPTVFAGVGINYNLVEF